MDVEVSGVDEKTKKIIEDLEREREALFRKFLEFSDRAEEYNRKAYEITCRIECINLALRKAGDLGLIDPPAEEERTGPSASHVPRAVQEEEALPGEETECDFERWWEPASPGEEEEDGEEDEEEEEEEEDGSGGGRKGADSPA